MEHVQAVIHLKLLENHASAIEKAIRPELQGGSSKVSADVKRSRGEIAVELEADKLADVRAALNSYLRLINVSEETVKVSSGVG
ncbi:MAG: hypothetical protein HYU39_00055 [Thaumarchaeota archaeon]|nr:hypothetical protein [Nitrososphaerota archaeon]